jgi:hypothetical protein
MIKLTDLRWRRRGGPSDLLVGKVADFWIVVVPRSGREIGKEDTAHDLPYATLFVSAGPQPFDGPALPENKSHFEE